ncbi:MAG: outer membrane beta-barrel protein [Nibricoccus sp.]
MKTLFTLRHILALITFLVLSGSVQAQMDAGLLGKRYAGLGFFSEDVRSSNIDNGDGVELYANVPVCNSLDAGLKTSYEKFSAYKLSDRRISGFAIGYVDMDWIKPFAEASVTSTAQSSTVRDIKYKNNETLWAVGIGLEIPVARSTAVTCSATRNEYFNSDFDTYWTYKVGVSTWFTPKFGGSAAVSIWDGESTTYSLGLNVRF